MTVVCASILTKISCISDLIHVLDVLYRRQAPLVQMDNLFSFVIFFIIKNTLNEFGPFELCILHNLGFADCIS